MKQPHSFVYVLTSPGDPYRWIKIGVSKNPRLRLSGLLAGSPARLDLFGTVQCSSQSEAYRIEGEAHRRLKPIRIHGEWFKCCPHQAIQIVTMIRDEVGLDLIAKHVECQRLYYMPNYAGDERAERVKAELVAAGVWRPTLLDQYIRARDAGAAPTYDQTPIAV